MEGPKEASLLSGSVCSGLWTATQWAEGTSSPIANLAIPHMILHVRIADARERMNTTE
jgi:hypothetical protein